MFKNKDPEEGFHCFCEELLSRTVGIFPDINVLLKAWRSLTEEVKRNFQRREEEEERKERQHQKYLERMYLEWEEDQEIEKLVLNFGPWEEQMEEVTRKSVCTLEKAKILIQEREQLCLREVLVEELKEKVEAATLGNQSWLAGGLLPEQERGEQTPGAPRSAARAARVRRSRGGRLSKMQRLLDYQLELCNSCGLPPSRLMVEGKKRKRTKEKRTRKNWKKRLEDGGEQDIMLSLAPLEVRLDRRLREGATEPDARLGCPEEGEEEWRRGEEVGGPGLLPTFTGPVTASRSKFPRMLRQAHVGDMVEGGLPGRGPEIMWVDQWMGQGWAGPLGSVYFCSSCQQAEGVWRI